MGGDDLLGLIAIPGDDVARQVGPNLGTNLMVGCNISFIDSLQRRCLVPASSLLLTGMLQRRW